MSAPNSSQDNQQETPQSRKPKRSLGFIESSEFQPSWLETGPLSPEMLATLQKQAQEQELVESQERGAKPISGGYTQRLAALENMYAEQEGETGANVSSVTEEVADTAQHSETEQADTPRTIPSATESAASDDAIVTQPSVEPEASTEAGPDIPTKPVPEPLAGEPVHRAETESIVFAPGSLPAHGEAVTTLPPEPEPVVTSILSNRDRTEPELSKPYRHPRFDGTARYLLVFGLGLLALALLTYLVNPFQRLALGSATKAQPIATPDVVALSETSGDWCITGEILPAGGAPLPLSDGGQNGDVVNGDGVFSLTYAPEQTGVMSWQVVDCQNPVAAYPEASSWVQIGEAGETATFFFDTHSQEDPLFANVPFVATAVDNTTGFRVVGDFQGWDPQDPAATLARVTPGVYQQVRQIAQPGTYQAFAIAGGLNQGIDAFGRSAEPTPFSFETKARGEYVVFLVDTNRGRATVLYGMPAFMTELAYGPGYRLLSYLLGVLGLALLGWMLARMAILGDEERWLDAGCPQCGQHELIRVSRQSQDRFLHVLGFPTYRYQCRVCTWQGRKLSESGAPVSAKATIAVNELPRQRYR